MIDFWERFSSRIERRPNSDCWWWTGTKDQDGYGVIRKDGKMLKAHRVMAEWALKRSLPRDQCVCHRCDNRACVRPTHFFIGTQTDNTRDRDSKGRVSHGEAHHAAKLTDEQVKIIREAPVGTRALAQQFGISRGYMWKIRANWKRREAPVKAA